MLEQTQRLKAQPTRKQRPIMKAPPHTHGGTKNKLFYAVKGTKSTTSCHIHCYCRGLDLISPYCSAQHTFLVLRVTRIVWVWLYYWAVSGFSIAPNAEFLFYYYYFFFFEKLKCFSLYTYLSISFPYLSVYCDFCFRKVILQIISLDFFRGIRLHVNTVIVCTKLS